MAPPPRPPAGKLGEACTAASSLAQGTCAMGLACLTSTTGGMCTSLGSCPGGTPFATLTMPELCGKTCSADSDCRTGAGYACDPGWQVCAPAGLAVPKPPTCSGAALVRKAFGKVTQISTAKAGATTNGPSVAVDREGNLVVAYNVGLPLSGPSTIGLAKAAVGAADVSMLDQDRPVTFERDNKVDPWLAQDRTGKLYMAWLAFDAAAAESRMQVMIASSDDGVTWSKPVAASDNATDCPGDQAHCLSRPLLTIGPDRNNPKADVLYVFYHSAAAVGLRSTHSTDGGATFSPSAAVGPGVFADAEVTSSGKLHVVFSGGGGNPLGDAANGVYYTSSSDGGATYAAPVRVSPEGEAVPVAFSSPQVVVDVPRRLLYAVYPQGGADGKWTIVLATSKDGGVAWSRVSVNDDPPCATHMLPSATLDAATGKLHILWLENRAGAGQVAYTACATGGEKCAKNEVVNDTPFAVFGLGRNSARGLGDAIDAVVDPKHKLLHAVWTQTIEEGGQVTGRVFTAAAKLK